MTITTTANDHSILNISISPEIAEQLHSITKATESAYFERRRNGRTLKHIQTDSIIQNANFIFGAKGWRYNILGGPTQHTAGYHQYYTARVEVSLGWQSASTRVGQAWVPVYCPSIPPHMVDEIHNATKQQAVLDGINQVLRAYALELAVLVNGTLADCPQRAEDMLSGPSCPIHGQGDHVRISPWLGAICCKPVGKDEVCMHKPLYADPDAPCRLDTSAGMTDARIEQDEVDMLIRECICAADFLGIDEQTLRRGFKNYYAEDMEYTTTNRLYTLLYELHGTGAPEAQGPYPATLVGAHQEAVHKDALRMECIEAVKMLGKDEQYLRMQFVKHYRKPMNRASIQQLMLLLTLLMGAVKRLKDRTQAELLTPIGAGR